MPVTTNAPMAPSAVQDPLTEFRAKDSVFTPSNLISLMRVMLVIPAIFGFVLHLHLLVAAIFVTAFISDLLDGMLARRLDSVSEVGKILDPLADKIFVGLVVITMAAYGLIPIWFLAIIIARDLIIVAAGIFAKRKLGVVLPSNYPGKAAVLTISITLLLIVCGVSGSILVFMEYSSVALMIVSLALYGQRLTKLLAMTRV